MAAIENAQNKLIKKILSIRDKNLFMALDQLISQGALTSNIMELTEEQKTMLKMSDDNIEKGEMISQDAMIKRNLEWLNVR